MSKYDLMTLILALLSFLTSLVLWYEKKQLQNEIRTLDDRMSNLELIQNKLLEDGRNKHKPNLSVELVYYYKNNYKFEISNDGPTEVRDVEMVLLLTNPEQSPISLSEYHSIFPLKKMERGAKIQLPAAITDADQKTYQVLLKWTNPDGTRVADQKTINL